MAHVRIFLSAVSAEFGSYRDALRRDLQRPNVTVMVQEDFIPTGTETLDKLDEYILQCDAVIHLVGDMTGALAQAPSTALLARRYPDFAERLPDVAPLLQPGAPALSYAQWEAWLALYHHKRLIVAVPHNGALRDSGYRLFDAERTAQHKHLQLLAAAERYPEVRFINADRLAVEVLRSKLHDLFSDKIDKDHGPPNFAGKWMVASDETEDGKPSIGTLARITAYPDRYALRFFDSDLVWYLSGAGSTIFGSSGPFVFSVTIAKDGHSCYFYFQGGGANKRLTLQRVSDH